MAVPDVLKFKEEIRLPILALFLISLGGLLLHIRIHPPTGPWNAVPFVSGLVAAFVLPFLFNQRKTVALAYVINLAAVIVGTAMMAYHSFTHWSDMPVTIGGILFQTTLADILILGGKLPLAHMILRHFRPKG